MPDEILPVSGARCEQPPIPVGTAANLSRPNGHELLHALTPLLVRIARLSGKGGSATQRAVYSFVHSSCLTSAASRGGWELRG